MPGKQKISEISAAEAAWIESQLADCCRFGSNELGVAVSGFPSCELLDEAFHRWLRPGIEADEANLVVNWVGVALGAQLLAGSSLLRWVIVSDRSGSELAVFGLDGVGDVMVVPQNLVAKRFPEGSPGFIAAVVSEVLGRVRLVERSARSRGWRRGK